jgi:hypothetical protein
MEARGHTAPPEEAWSVDRRFAAVAAGHLFRPGGHSLTSLHDVLDSALSVARELPPDDPGRTVLAAYGRRLLQITEPEIQGDEQ